MCFSVQNFYLGPRKKLYSWLWKVIMRNSFQEEDRKKREEREAASWERRYALPEQPAILVHPSPTAKSGKFDCTVMSLSLLLDYRQEDNKEHSFEVSMTASPFICMLHFIIPAPSMFRCPSLPSSSMRC